LIRKLFLDHPRSVNESYADHWRVANRFGLLMIAAGVGTMLHGFVPGILTRTGSRMVKKLYGEMMRRQPELASHIPAFSRDEWQMEYEI
jgi:hypothetical protein